MTYNENKGDIGHNHTRWNNETGVDGPYWEFGVDGMRWGITGEPSPVHMHFSLAEAEAYAARYPDKLYVVRRKVTPGPWEAMPEGKEPQTGTVSLKERERRDAVSKRGSSVPKEEP